MALVQKQLKRSPEATIDALAGLAKACPVDMGPHLMGCLDGGLIRAQEHRGAEDHGSRGDLGPTGRPLHGHLKVVGEAGEMLGQVLNGSLGGKLSNKAQRETVVKGITALAQAPAPASEWGEVLEAHGRLITAIDTDSNDDVKVAAVGALGLWLAKAECFRACLSCLGETGLKHKSDVVRAACLGALFAIIEAGASKGAGGLAPALSKMVQGATKSNTEHGDGIAALACLLALEQPLETKTWDTILKPGSFLLDGNAMPRYRAKG